MSEPKYKLVPVEASGWLCCIIKQAIESCSEDGTGDMDVYYKNIWRQVISCITSPPQDPRDEALRVAREALEYSDTSFLALGLPEHAEHCANSLRKIKELMGEK